MDFEVVQQELAGGLKVAVEAVPGAPSVHLGAWIRCGARYESPADNGLSHFLEHMVFKAGRRRDAQALSRDLEAIGGQFDAYTTHEATCYTMQVLPEHLGRACDLLAELLVGGAIDPEHVATEQQVVIEEILEADDSPGDLVTELTARQAWGGHSLGLPVLGTAATVGAFTPSRVADHRRRYYTADRTLVAAVGQVTAATLAREVGAALADLPTTGAVASDPVPTFQAGLAVKRLPVDQVHLCLAAPAFASDDPDRHALWLLDALLGATMSSRLFQEVRERRGLAYQISSAWQPQHDAGLLTIEAVANPRHLTELLRVTRGEIEAILEQGIAEEDLAWVKEYSRTTVILAAESLGSRLGRLARGVLFEGRRRTIQEILDAVQATSVEDVVRAARRVFGAGEWVLGAVGPVTDRRAEAWWKVVAQ